MLFFFLWYLHGDHRDLRSFPTRRSSDLRRAPRHARGTAGRSPRGAGRTTGCSDRKSTRLNSSHLGISYAVFCLKKKKNKYTATRRTGGIILANGSWTATRRVKLTAVRRC